MYLGILSEVPLLYFREYVKKIFRFVSLNLDAMVNVVINFVYLVGKTDDNKALYNDQCPWSNVLLS